MNDMYINQYRCAGCGHYFPVEMIHMSVDLCEECYEEMMENAIDAQEDDDQEYDY